MAGLALLAGGLTASGTAYADPPEQIINGTFDSGHAPWWGTGNITLDSSGGRLCADIPGSTSNPWDVIIGQNDIPLVAGETYAFSVDATGSPAKPAKMLVQLPVDPYTQYLSATPTVSEASATYDYTFTAPVSLPNAQVAFQIGGSAAPWRFCVDNVSLKGGAAPEVYVPDTGPRVRVNQVGYLTAGPKRATVVTDAAAGVAWELRSAADAVVASGVTAPRGLDATSGQAIHTIDFSGYATAGTGYTLRADGETSRPFDIGADLYDSLATDALKFYYPQRSGIAIDNALRPGYGRPAGHVGVAPNSGDTSVACLPGTCDYSLNVAGGWYDAGDHGKYVVNGGISVFQLVNEFERTSYARSGGFTDGELDIPESGNGVPDILDEARWEQEFLLSMQVPAGKPLAGMVHHKIHDDNWTGLPLLPNLDPQERHLHPPSTAATLNLAATAAQSARVYAAYDKAFAQRNLAAARKAWTAALAHPAVYAPAGGVGGGPYDDTDVTDEFYWAAAELYLTTGEAQFKNYLLASPLHTAPVFGAGGFDWGHTAGLGRLDLALLPSAIPNRAAIRASVVAGAQSYLAAQAANGYAIAYAPNGNAFDWGSNALVANNLIVVAAAYDITGQATYRNGVVEGMDYLLGRNALNMSYVTGYGEVNSHNQHSRWYSHQLNPDLPNPPKGTLSGGPNSSIQDPVAQQKLVGCVAQFCYIDDIESWSTNELTVNWNAPLAWISAFLADQGAGGSPAASSCSVTYTKHAEWADGSNIEIVVRNTGTTTINGWSLKWSFPTGQSIDSAWGMTTSQSGPTVTATNLGYNGKLVPGASAYLGFIGKPGLFANPNPVFFTLNGASCTG
nr:glycoside hydrolase family 9 protein [Allocatelliglobosispora scoriae]